MVAAINHKDPLTPQEFNEEFAILRDEGIRILNELAKDSCVAFSREPNSEKVFFVIPECSYAFRNGSVNFIAIEGYSFNGNKILESSELGDALVGFEFSDSMLERGNSYGDYSSQEFIVSSRNITLTEIRSLIEWLLQCLKSLVSENEIDEEHFSN